MVRSYHSRRLGGFAGVSGGAAPSSDPARWVGYPSRTNRKPSTGTHSSVSAKSWGADRIVGVAIARADHAALLAGNHLVVPCREFFENGFAFRPIFQIPRETADDAIARGKKNAPSIALADRCRWILKTQGFLLRRRRRWSCHCPVGQKNAENLETSSTADGKRLQEHDPHPRSRVKHLARTQNL